MSERYHRSEELLDRALKSIPGGTQTFSKSITQFPREVSPFYLQNALGSHAWDVDGNEYIDLVSALCAVTLGHRDPDVTAAVQAQLEEGVILSLPHPVEIDVAEAIIEMVPCAEKVRFGKNGSDATSGAIRVARAYTGRDHVAVCGYHGWQDWYIGSTARGLGVPKVVSALTHTFVYNDVASLERIFAEWPDEIAAVIMEPMNTTWPAEGFLESVADLTRSRGAVLVFDETITGFRYANGGAQEYFGVMPDLATFGKGLANGYPISAVAGRADIMRMMEEVFFSFTFGGEALSLAAALATMNKLRREPVVESIAQRGAALLAGLDGLIEETAAGGFLSTSGHPAWSFLSIAAAGSYTSWQLKTLFMQEMLARGILTYGTHNMSYAHSEGDIGAVLAAYEEVLPVLRDAVEGGTLESRLRCEPLQPLFKIR